MSEYKKDEAYRITGAITMVNGHTYTHRVHNSGGMFTVMLESEEFPKGFFEKRAKYCKNVSNPCAVESRDLKDALIRSIEMHQKLVHHLKVVS
jgi:site-specific DNA-adenine methylase